MGSRFPADSLSPRGSGDSHWLYITLQVTYYTTLSSMSRLMTLRPNEEVTTNGSSGYRGIRGPIPSFSYPSSSDPHWAYALAVH